MAQEDSSPGRHQSFFLHTGTWKPLCGVFVRGVGTLRGSELEPELEPGLSLGLGFSPAESETLDAVGTGMLPELGVGSVGKLAELGADAF